MKCYVHSCHFFAQAHIFSRLLILSCKGPELMLLLLKSRIQHIKWRAPLSKSNYTHARTDSLTVLSTSSPGRLRPWTLLTAIQEGVQTRGTNADESCVRRPSCGGACLSCPYLPPATRHQASWAQWWSMTPPYMIRYVPSTFSFTAVQVEWIAAIETS